MLKITTTASQVYKALDDLNKKKKIQLAIALTRTAQIAKNKHYQAMKKVFDRPTPSTLNSLYIKTANINKLESEVGIKDFFGKGTPASEYLAPQILGGSRKYKKSELRLIEKGLMKSGFNLLPNEDMRLDKYGNVPKGVMTQMLSVLKAHTEMGFTANTTKGSAKRNRKLPGLFAYQGDRLQKGIYIRIHKSTKQSSGATAKQRYDQMRYLKLKEQGRIKINTIRKSKSRMIKPYMIFGRMSRYNKRYKFAEISIQAYNDYFQREFNNAK